MFSGGENINKDDVFTLDEGCLQSGDDTGLRTVRSRGPEKDRNPRGEGK